MLWIAVGIALAGLVTTFVVGWLASERGDLFSELVTGLALGATFLTCSGVLVYVSGKDAGDAAAVKRIACEAAGGTWYANGATVDGEIVHCLESLRPLTVAP